MSQRVDFGDRMSLPAESPRTKLHHIERLDCVGFGMFIKMHHAPDRQSHRDDAAQLVSSRPPVAPRCSWLRW